MSTWEWELLYVGAPVVVGFVATALTRIRWRKNGPWMALLGSVLAFGFVVLSYYRSQPSGAPNDGCSDCGNYLGRWWEPDFTVFLAVVGYFLWLLGIGAGIGATAGVNAMRRALQRPVADS